MNFILGSKSQFDDLCHDVLREVQTEYPQIKLIHYRTAYPEIDETQKQYYLGGCDDTVFPKGARNSGKAVYIKRNQAMIEDSDVCVFYYNKDNPKPISKSRNKMLPDKTTASGTERAYNYAVKLKKEIVNLYEYI